MSLIGDRQANALNKKGAQEEGEDQGQIHFSKG
jgi:hypothetical protein